MSISWPDLMVAAIVLWFAIFALRRGFIAVLLSLAAFVTSFILSFALYSSLATFATAQFGWSPVWSKPLAFVVVWIIIESLFSVVARYATSRLYWGSQNS